jgi:hypothetical protein
MADAVDTCTRTDERRALKRAAPARGGSAPCGAAAAAAFRILDLPLELQSLIVEQMPLRTMARLALTHADWAAMVQRSLRRGHSWAQSYADHRCCHDLTGDARAAIAPMGKWAWRDHLHVLEAVAVRAHPSEPEPPRHSTAAASNASFVSGLARGRDRRERLQLGRARRKHGRVHLVEVEVDLVQLHAHLEPLLPRLLPELLDE